MNTYSFNLEISYSQFAVFDPATKHPFNEWTETHVSQGFSWRNESACFRTLAAEGEHEFTTNFHTALPELYPNSVRAILVPMPRLRGEKLEVASMGDSKAFEVPPGVGGLLVQFCPASSNERPSVLLDLISIFSPSFAILRADDDIKNSASLLKNAGCSK